MNCNKEIIKGITILTINIANIMWVACIFVAILRGEDFYMVLNTVFMAALCLLCLLLERRIKTISAEKEKYKFFGLTATKERERVVKFFHEAIEIITKGKQAGKSPQDILEEVDKKIISIINGVLRW